MADTKTYVTELWQAQCQIAQQMGFDLNYAPLPERITLLVGDVAGAVILGALTASGATTDAAIQSALAAAVALPWAEQSVPMQPGDNSTPPLVL